MKTMLLSDFLSIRRSLPQSLVLAAVVAVICAIFGGITFAGAIVCAMMPITIVFSMQLYDDQNDWSGYRLTLPVNRRQVVWGRYLFMAFCAVGAFLIGCVIVVLCGLVTEFGVSSQGQLALTDTPAKAFTPLSEAVPIGLISAYGALLFVFVLLAITLPLLMRYGLTQAVRFVPVICCVIFLLVLAWLSDSGSTLLVGLDLAFMDGYTMLWLAIGITAFCCGLYLASAALTAKLYATREF